MKDMSEKSDLTKSEELQTLFRTLSVIQSNAIVRVMRGNDSEDMRQIAIRETEKLQSLAREGGRCPVGEIWDETLGRCV